MQSLKTYFRSTIIKHLTPYAIDSTIEKLLKEIMEENACELDLDQIVITPVPGEKYASGGIAIVTISAYREL